MDPLTPSRWIARCGQRLHERSRTVGPAELEEAAIVIWQDQGLRALPPEDAAAAWLRPITSEP